MTAHAPKTIPGQKTAPTSSADSKHRKHRPKAEGFDAQEKELKPKEKGPPKDAPSIGISGLTSQAASKGLGPTDDKAKNPPAGPNPTELEYMDSAAYGQETGKGSDPDKARAARERLYPAAVTRWCGPGDDPATISYLVVDKRVTPDKYLDYVKLAQTRSKQVNKADFSDRYSGMTADERMGVTLYSTDLSYALNAMLRGGLKSDRWTTPLKILLPKIVAALAKVPEGARNGSNPAQKLDDDKGKDEVIQYDESYRADAWNARFDDYFANNMQVGKSVTENAFMSTTLQKGNYGLDFPVLRVIEGAKVAKSICDLSASTQEAEALFAPGSQFSVSSLEVEDTKTNKKQHVTDPKAVFPKNDRTEGAFNRHGLQWTIRMKHTGYVKPKKPSKMSRFRDRVLGIRKADA